MEEDEYLRDGTDYGNITRIHDDFESTDKLMETAYKKSLLLNKEDVNVTIVSENDVEVSSSLWEGIMGLVEDFDRDSKLVDVSMMSCINFQGSVNRLKDRFDFVLL